MALVRRVTEDGLADVLYVRSPHEIVKQLADKPTLLLDATLPDLDLVRPFYPNVELLAEIEAEMPHARIRYVPDAPTAARKFSGPEAAPRNARDLRRYILKRYLEHDRAETLVICQQGGETKLRELGLPENVHVAHYNAIAGLDRYKDTRLLILAGRILPGPNQIEPLAGALTGIEPRSANTEKATGGRWYDPVEHGIRLQDGTGIATRGDKHPDPTVEAIRWASCEAELLQALGRVRAVNRDEAHPVTIDILTNVALPISADEVLLWAKVLPGDEVEMLAEGMWLDSPTDMSRCWPKVWPTEKAAEHWRARFTRPQTPLEESFYRDLGACGRYQLPGPRLKWRTFRYAPDVIADPAAWLTDRLGPLAGIALDTPHVGILDALFDAAAVGRPEPPASHSITCFEPRQGEPAPCHRGHVRPCAVEIAL